MVPAAVSKPLSTDHARARLLGLLATAAIAAAGLPVATASAAPPSNDAPTAPLGFDQESAENGIPQDRQAIAELAEATPDRNVPRCLGPQSFARTVWFAVPPASTPQEITVEGTGRTLGVLDMAAFVQPANGDPLKPTLSPPNSCAGVGSGGADAAEEPTSGVTLRVPAGRATLIQVGRRGTLRSPEDERAVLSLDVQPLPAPTSGLLGDSADAGTPSAHIKRPTTVPLSGATLTGEDPAEPPCPSLGSVWRRIVPTQGGPRLISVNGIEASTLTVFSGATPTTANALDCVNRVGRGDIQMKVPTRAGRPLWIRIGTDRPPDRTNATLQILPGANAFVVDGGPAGFDPTSFGPGGGLPSNCAKADATKASLVGPRIAGKVKRLNRSRTIRTTLNLKKGPVCDVTLELVGPRGRVYATARALRLPAGRRAVTLGRHLRLARGGYTLRVTALSALGEHVLVRSAVKGKLT
jgi:hypothetical protein